MSKLSARLMLLLVSAALAGPLVAQAPAPAPVAGETAAPAVPREVLERYVGRYELNGTVVTVGVTEDGRLTAQLAGQPPGPPLRTVAANEFVADAVGVRLFFEGEGPRATRIRSQYAGSEVVGTRIPDGAAAAVSVPLPPANEALAAYASTADAVELPDGRMLNFVCMGRGSPTVILTAGMGNVSYGGWSGVQPAMARTTRVCAWDRPGFGLSDGSPARQTVATTTADLEAALTGGTIPGPFVMVGHSLGAYESLMFADRHPDKVVGMVLVDPSIPDQQAAVERAGLGSPDRGEGNPVQRIRQCAADLREGRIKPGGADPNGCFVHPPAMPRVLAEALMEKTGNPIQFETMASFLTSFAEDSAIVVNPSRHYGDMPLVVLTATLAPSQPPGASPEQIRAGAAFVEEWNKGHDELAALSTRGINARVPGANHAIQGTRPQVVIDAVEAVVGEARAGKP